MDVLCVQKADDIVCAKVLFFFSLSLSLSAMWMNSLFFNLFPAQMSACVYHLVATSSAEQRLRGIVENIYATTTTDTTTQQKKILYKQPRKGHYEFSMDVTDRWR
jgi:predicted aspartyl protease